MIESRAPRRMRHSWEARCRLVGLMLDGVSPSCAAIACGASRATAYRALARYRAGGWEALRDRPPIARSHPARLSVRRSSRSWSCGERPAGAPSAWRECWAGRRRRSGGCCAGTASRDEQAAPRPPANRYEYAAPGELVHLDIKKLGRFWQVGKRALSDGSAQPPRRLAVPAPGNRRSLALRRRAATPYADQQ